MLPVRYRLAYCVNESHPALAVYAYLSLTRRVDLAFHRGMTGQLTPVLAVLQRFPARVRASIEHELFLATRGETLARTVTDLGALVAAGEG